MYYIYIYIAGILVPNWPLFQIETDIPDPKQFTLNAIKSYPIALDTSHIPDDAITYNDLPIDQIETIITSANRVLAYCVDILKFISSE